MTEDRPARVLVVDDEEDIRDFVRMVLEEAGYEVLTADNGVEALQALREHQLDLMILDLMMPILSGWGVLSAVGQDHPPFIVVMSAARDIERANAMGASALLSKPFHPQSLLQACRDVLKR